MKTSFRAISFSLMLMSPMALTMPILAQEHFVVPAATRAQVPASVPENPLLVAQSDAEFEAYNKRYNYWDAIVLARFWGDDISETKARMGRKLKWGGADEAYLQQAMMDARIKALANSDELNLYRDSGYGYDDAEALARLWGDSSPYEAKLRIERNLIMGNFYVIQDALKLTSKQE